MVRIVGTWALAFLLGEQVGSTEPVPQARKTEGASALPLLSKSNLPPQVKILFPPPTVFHLVASVHLRASASDPDGTVKEVRFYVGTNLVGVATNAPYEAVCYPSQRTADFMNSAQFFTAVAIDNEGASTKSDPVEGAFEIHVSGNSFQLLNSLGQPIDFVVVQVAPLTFQFRALLAFSDGTGNPVDFFLGTNKVGTVVDPPYVLTLTNVPAGDYTLQVGTTNVSGDYVFYPPATPVLHVIEPAFNQPSRTNSDSFSFNFGGTLPRATNIIEQSSDFRIWLPIATNVTTTNAFSFRDTNATEPFRFYRMKLFTAEPLLP